jgi:flagellar hook-length control protein FliK
MATGEAQKQLAEADPAKSEIVDTNAEAATPADAPKPPKPVGTQSDASSPSVQPRPDMSPDKPGEQPDALIKTDDPALMTKHNIDPSAQTTQLAAPALAVSSHAATPHAVPVSTAQPVPVDAVAVEIAAQARAGNSRFEIRLDPPELGRIDVRLDVDHEGNVKSRLVIERADTYDLLRRDQSTLERALQQAGLKTSDNALEFSLRDHGFAQQRDPDDQSPRTHAMIHESDVAPSEAANGYARLLSARGGIDIRV